MVRAICKVLFGLGALQQTTGVLQNGALRKQSHSTTSIDLPVVAQQLTNGRNLCIDGKRVPDLYVLGVQKCGTTTMYKDFHDAVQQVHMVKIKMLKSSTSLTILSRKTIALNKIGIGGFHYATLLQ